MFHPFFLKKTNKYQLVCYSLRAQAYMNLRAFNIKKSEALKLKSVIDEHNKVSLFVIFRCCFAHSWSSIRRSV